MHAIKIKKHIDSDLLSLPIPKEMIGKTVEIILLVESDAVQEPSATGKRKPGTAKGMIEMADDFQKPLDEQGV